MQLYREILRKLGVMFVGKVRLKMYWELRADAVSLVGEI